MSECEANSSVRFQPMYALGKWCKTHERPISACARIRELEAERDVVSERYKILEACCCLVVSGKAAMSIKDGEPVFQMVLRPAARKEGEP
jgi:hypothetical protein